ncbi:MAG: ferredoxin, partial [Bacteroidetes bacterium]
FDAITITSFLAYIDFEKCTLCRKCVEVCPTDAIWEVNFKPRKPKLPKTGETDAKEVTDTKKVVEAAPKEKIKQEQEKEEPKEENKE